MIKLFLNNTIEILAHEYGLGAVHSVTLLPSDSTTIVANLQTETGLWFIKRHQAGKSRNDIEREYDLLFKLKNAGFCLANLPISNLTKSIALPINNELWTVHKSIKCDHNFQWTKPNWTEKHCCQAGCALALLHVAGRTVVAQDTTPFQEFSLDVLIDSLNQVLISIKTKNIKLDYLKQLENSCQSNFQNLISEIHNLESKTKVHRTIIHGDFHPGNVLYSNGQVQAIIDYDYARVDNPLFDLGYALVMFCSNSSTTDGTTILIDSFKTALFAGYHEELEKSHASDLLLMLNQTQLLSAYTKLSCYLILLWALEGINANHPSFNYNRVIKYALQLLEGLDQLEKSID